MHPLHISKQEGRGIDLLLLVDPTKMHYVWIKDLACMLHKSSKYEHRRHPCRRCYICWMLVKKDCEGIGKKPQRIVMPEQGKHALKFTNYHKQMHLPFIICPDIELLNIPIEGCSQNPHRSYTRQIAKQEARSYCYMVIRSDGTAKAPILCRWENAVEHFLESLWAKAEEIESIYQRLLLCHLRIIILFTRPLAC